MDKRQGEPGTSYTVNDYLAGQVTLHADAAGLIEIKDESEARVADLLGLEPAPKKPAPASPKED